MSKSSSHIKEAPVQLGAPGTPVEKEICRPDEKITGDRAWIFQKK